MIEFVGKLKTVKDMKTIVEDYERNKKEYDKER